MAGAPLFELVGLPGVGKTHLCTRLVRNGYPLSTLSGYRMWLRALRLHWLVLPYVVYRFRRAFALLSADVMDDELGPGRLVGRLILVPVRRRLGRLSREERPVYSLAHSLSAVFLEYCLLKAEASVRGSGQISDEGMIQWGTGFWLLAERREETFGAFLQQLPRQLVPIVLLDHPRAVFERATVRDAEIPASFAGERPGGTLERFDAFDRWLREGSVTKDWQVLDVSATGDCLASLKRILEEAGAAQKVRVLPRPRARA